jgi:holo-[acyl-carrier protein] synthase
MRVFCGTDIVHIHRIEKAVIRQGERFLKRVYTAREIALCTSDGQYRIASLAARFAGKEAIAKALGTGVGPLNISWTDLEILGEDSGAPTALLHDAARERFASLGGVSLAVSLAHELDIAQAFCVILSSSDSTSNDAVPSTDVVPSIEG